MAVETTNEKLALMSFYKPYGMPIPVSDDGLDQGDLQHLVWDYPGILWTAVGLDYIHIFGSSAYVIPQYVADLSENVLIEGDLEIQNDLYVCSDLTVDGTISGSDLILTFGGYQDYQFTNRSSAMTIQGQSSGSSLEIEFYTKDGDSTDSCRLRLYAAGIPTELTDAEYIDLGYFYDFATYGNIYRIAAGASGAGDVWPLYISTGSNYTQLVLNTDGTCSFGSDISVNGDIEADEIVTTYGFYHDRGDPSAIDWDKDDFTQDGPVGDYSNTYWHDLDCSAIVPEDAKAIVFMVNISANAAGAYFIMRKNGNSYANAFGWTGTQVSGIWAGGQLIVPCDSNQVVEYWARSSSEVTWNGINVTIVGWLK